LENFRADTHTTLRSVTAGEVTVTLHVVPVNDLIDHDSADTCICGPRTEPVQRDDGSYGWLVVHHSLDGRERLEPAAGDT
jgi:antitoxin (DNA-binding transcriptional repressor) of toxin-antitoxin stability system